MIEAKVFVFDATPAFPCILLQVTVLVGSYMIWAGVSDVSITPEEPQDVLEHRISHGRLASDWACAMPPLKVRLLPFLSERNHSMTTRTEPLPSALLYSDLQPMTTRSRCHSD